MLKADIELLHNGTSLIIRAVVLIALLASSLETLWLTVFGLHPFELVRRGAPYLLQEKLARLFWQNLTLIGVEALDPLKLCTLIVVVRVNFNNRALQIFAVIQAVVLLHLVLFCNRLERLRDLVVFVATAIVCQAGFLQCEPL